jgi:hypothetical protein
MRKGFAIVVAVMAAFVVGAITVALAGGTPTDVQAPMQIKVVEHAATDRVVDLGAPGDSPGDLLTFHNALFDASNQDRVGKDQGECVRISPGQGTWECRWTAWIDGEGSLTVEGRFSDVHPSTLAITGGTGTYRNARGTMQLGFRNDPAEFDFTYRVIP